MATAKVTKTTITLGTKSKTSGTVHCNICKGTGRLKTGYNKKKK